MNIEEIIKLLKQDFDMVYQAGIAKGKEIAVPFYEYRNLFVQDDLVYHVNFASAAEGEVKSNDSYLPFVVDKAESITNPWSGNFRVSFGDGYVTLGQYGSCINFFGGGADTLLSGQTHVSVEFVTQPMDGTWGFSDWVVGPSFSMSGFTNPERAGGGAVLNAIDGAQMGGPTSSVAFAKEIVPGGSISTFALTLGFNNADGDDATHDYALNIYGNGHSYPTQKITAPSAGFVTKNGRVSLGNNDGMKLNIYAFRVYTRELTPNEVLQNHFADIALINQLDITEFLKLTDTEKQKVYEAFENVPANRNKAAFKEIIDTAIQKPDIQKPHPNEPYYDLFVRDDLVYHVNFASATEGTVESNVFYLPFVVDKAESITNPWSGNIRGSFGNGYLALTDKDTKINFFGGGADALLDEQTHVSVEFVTQPTETGVSDWVAGPSFTMSNYTDNGDKDTAVNSITVPQMNGPASTVTFPEDVVPDGSISTFALTIGFNNADGDDTTHDYALGIYGNGHNCSIQKITTTNKGFISSDGGIRMYSGALNIYAFRIYTRELTSEEILQNHFADIALINQLDITEFLSLDEAKKQAVYAAFENVTANTDKDALQAKLDTPLN